VTGDEDSDADASEPTDASNEGPDDAGTEADTEAEGRTDAGVPAEIVALAVGRQIVFTGHITIESADVAQATTAAIDAVFGAGGAVWGQDTRTGPDPQTVLTIRVPPADFDRVLAAVAGVDGTTLVSQSVTSDDVTETVVDLDARIIAAESSVARVQTLLDAAVDLSTVFSLEEELASRQAALERLRGQRETVGDQVALATITLTIVELDPDRLDAGMEVVAWLGENTDEACPGVPDLSVAANGSAVLCAGINNTGEDILTDIDVRSSTLRLRMDDFGPIDGADGNEDGEAGLSLSPGEELLVSVTLEAEDGFVNRVDASDSVEIDVEVTATPETTPTDDLTEAASVVLAADVEDPLPGFADSFSAGWSAMATILGVAMIVIGTALPFLPFLALAAWLRHRAWRRRPGPAGPTLAE
jgi:hypothetical protein